MGRYWDIIKESYEREKEIVAKKVYVEEKDFLPAAIEIMEKPASPAGRLMIWLICGFFVIALVWSIFGKIDIVAVAQGKVVPFGQSKVVQSFEAGVVRTIHVKNGDVVKEGDVLIELDATANTADVSRLERELLHAKLTINKNKYLLGKLNAKDMELEFPAGMNDDDKELQTLLAESQFDEFRATRTAFREQILEKQSEKKVVVGELDKLEKSIPLLEEQVKGLKDLSDEGVAPRFQYLEYYENLLSRRKDIEIQNDRLEQIEAGVRSISKQQEQHKEEFKKQIISELTEASKTKVAVSQELVKAEQTGDLHTIKSPVNGVVQQSVVNTLGGVVRSGDPLMVIVPVEQHLQVEASVLNKDVGFVRLNQQVEVKLEAFPFTKYGVIEGEVISIDRDAVQDEQQGLIYPARISMQKSSLMVNGEEVPINAGMGLSAEIKIGQRRVIEFVLAPLFRYKAESFRER